MKETKPENNKLLCQICHEKINPGQPTILSDGVGNTHWKCYWTDVLKEAKPALSRSMNIFSIYGSPGVHIGQI